MPRLILKFLSDETGATSIEYALIAAGISVAVLVGVIKGIGTSMNAKYDSVSAALK